MTAEERFRQVYADHRTAILGYALRRVGSPADAADVLAETFMVAWRRIDQLPGGDRTRPWLFGVARKVLANQRRGDHRRMALAERLRHELTARSGLGDSQVDPAVLVALDRLGETDRELLRLFAWEQLDHDQVATVLGISAGAVRTRLHRARRRLEALLAEPRQDGHHRTPDGRPAPARPVTAGPSAPPIREDHEEGR